MNRAALVCFAVKEEAAVFKTLSPHPPDVRILVTGMGQRNTERAVRPALDANPPALVLTCGFAGALDPRLKIGDVLFDADAPLAETLRALGAAPAKFHCAERVAVTVAEKAG